MMYSLTQAFRRLLKRVRYQAHTGRRARRHNLLRKLASQTARMP